MKRILIMSTAAGAALAAFATVSIAQDWGKGWYAGGTIAWQSQHDSGNTGKFTSDAFTGQGSEAIPAGSVVRKDTRLALETRFDETASVSAEIGRRLPSGFRSGLEIAYSESDVDGHSGVIVGPGQLNGEPIERTPVDTQDAALLTGDTTPLGVTVGEVVADGRGSIQNTFAFANVYYDFNRGGRIEPYLGGGLGVTRAEVEYSPSGVDIVKDTETKFAYQVKAGATYRLSEQLEVFGEATYRESDEIDVSLNLLPAGLDVENKQTLVGVGLRYRFGG